MTSATTWSASSPSRAARPAMSRRRPSWRPTANRPRATACSPSSSSTGTCPRSGRCGMPRRGRIVSRRELVELGDRLLRAADQLVAAVAEGYRSVERGAHRPERRGAARVPRRAVRRGRDRHRERRPAATREHAQRPRPVGELPDRRDRRGRGLRRRRRDPLAPTPIHDGAAIGPRPLATRRDPAPGARLAGPRAGPRSRLLAGSRRAARGARRDRRRAVDGGRLPVDPGRRGPGAVARAADRDAPDGAPARPRRLDREPRRPRARAPMLADDGLLRTIVDRELGPVLKDARMGDELSGRCGPTSTPARTCARPRVACILPTGPSRIASSASRRCWAGRSTARRASAW